MALLAVLIVASLSGAGVYVWRRASVQPASGQGAALPSPTATTSSPEPSPEPTPSAVLHPTPSIGLPTRDLTYGDKGRQVRNLQLLLKGLGYDVPATDGRFGFDTLHAVVAFQKVHGLSRDGTVGPKTRQALASPVTPKALHPKQRGVSFEVDLTRQVLYLLHGGRIVRIVDASTGGGYSFVSRGIQKVADTTPGEFHVYQQFDDWYQSSVGPMYRSSFYYRGFAIHGSSSVPPYPSSHGCVRVTLSAIDRLWPEIHLGTPVSVYRT